MQEQQTTLHQYVENDNMALPVASVGCFSTQECLEIVRVSEQQLQIPGVAGTRGDLTHLRDSRIVSIPPNPDTQWIFQKIQAAVLRANQLYRHELVGFREGLQVATYTNGGHYGWHLDIGKGSMSTRKLSVSVQLTDAHEYQGGDLEFLCLENPNVPKSIGAAIIFPSFLPHRVTPVTSGTRKSLVAWIHGPSFR
jgi:PKHD-type hydroxylase